MTARVNQMGARRRNTAFQVDLIALGGHIRFQLQSRNMTQLSFCERSGISNATLQRLLNGRCRYVDTIITACRLLWINLDYFVKKVEPE